MGKYIINEGHEYYDENECDARGYPVKRWRSTGGSYESISEPEVGDSWIFEENGKLYQRRITAVHFNGCVYENTDSYDVEYSTSEIKPDQLVMDEKWVLNKETHLGETKHGVFNGRNEIVVPYEYDYIKGLNFIYDQKVTTFGVRKGDKWGIIDCKGGTLKHITPLEYDEIKDIDIKNAVKVRKDNKWGVIDCSDGSLKIPISYDSIEHFGRNWIAKQGENDSYYDNDFNVISLQLSHYKIIQPAYDGLFIAEDYFKENTVGVLDLNGKVIIPMKFYSIICVRDGFLAEEYKYSMVGRNDPKRYLFDQNGQTIIGPFKKLTDILDDETEINGEMYSFSTRNNVIIPDSVTKITGGAFYWCNQLESVTIGQNVAYIGPNSFVKCPKLLNISVDKDNPYFSSDDGVLFDKNKTTIIKYPSFKSDETFIIPETVKKISRCAFDDASFLKKIIIPNGLKEIDDGAFRGCRFIKEFEIPDSVTSIGQYVFRNCKSLELIKLPNSLRNIPDGTFEDCNQLETIQLPTNVETIGKSAFKGCSQLKFNSFPNSIRKIDEYAFEGCSQLESISFSDSIREIGYHAFKGCLQLKYVFLPDSACKIEKYAFDDCSQLEFLRMPKIIQGWDELFFPRYRQHSIKHFQTTLETYEEIRYRIPENVTVEIIVESLEEFGTGKYGNYYIRRLPISEENWNRYRDIILNNCKGIGEVFLGTKLLYCNSKTYSLLPYENYAIYGDYAFAHCEMMKMENLLAYCKNFTEDYRKKIMEKESELVLPDSVQSIGKGAFMGCTILVSVTIPESVTYLGDEAFKDCINLKEITIPKSIPWLGKNTFSGCNSLKRMLMKRKLYKKSKWKLPETIEVLFYDEE